MEIPPQGPAAPEPDGETQDAPQPTPAKTDATGELPAIVPPIQAPAAPVSIPPYTPPMPSQVPGATTELPVAPVNVPPFSPPLAPESPVQPAHTPPSPLAAPAAPATPAMTPLRISPVTPPPAPAGPPPYRPPSAFDVPAALQEVASQPLPPAEAPAAQARKPKLPARMWAGVKRCLRMESLITIGIPALFAIIGILAIILWQRAAPPEGDLQPRLPQAQGPTSTSPGGTVPGAPMPGAEQGTQPGALPGPASGPPFGTPPGQAPSGSGMAPPGSAPSGMAPSGSPPSGIAPSGSSPPSGGGPANTSVPSAPGSWPGFRGAMLDNIAHDAGGLATNWGSAGPKRLWSVRLGEGYAGPAVANSRVYVLDYDDAGKRDVLRCFALATGQQVWEQSYPADVKRNHGYSRTVPATDGRYVVSIGPKLTVLCCDAITGRVAWKMDMVSQWGATVPAWYAGQCPLIDGSRVILAPSGKAMMIAVDLASGKVAWQAPNPRGWKMTHVSIVPVTLNGKKMYVYCGSGGVSGVDASNGSILWDTDAWRVSTATVPSPLPIGDGRIFLCGGYNSGAMMIRLKPAGGKFTVEELFRLKPDVFGSEQQTPILYQGHIYGVLPAPSKELACLDLNGKQVWRSGSTNRFGLGPYMLAGGMLYVLNENGELNLVQATPSGYKPMAKAKVLNGPEAWAPMALAGTRLLARDVTTMVCLNVGR